MRGACLVVFVSICTASAAAQTAIPTAAQNELYARARNAFGDGDYAEAIELLQAALRLGDINIFRLSLGRALYRDGRCSEARWEYDRALRAPPVADPTPDQVEVRVEAYREDLSRDCPATLTLRCSPSSMRVAVGDSPPAECGSVTLRPGVYQLRGEADGQTVERSVELGAMQDMEVRMEVTVRGRDRGPTPRTLRRRRTFGWATAGSSVALLAGALLVDTVVLGDAIDDFNNKARAGSDGLRAAQSRVDGLQTGALLMYAGSAALAGTAVVLFLAGRKRTRETGQTSAWLSTDSAGVIWQTNY